MNNVTAYSGIDPSGATGSPVAPETVAAVVGVAASGPAALTAITALTGSFVRRGILSRGAATGPLGTAATAGAAAVITNENNNNA